MLADPIAAIATAPGPGALAVLRVSGIGAFDVVARVVPSFTADEPRRARLAWFTDGAGERIDRGVYTVFPGPASYTGDDLVELSCHGGALVPVRLLAALLAAGARQAEPGEFTRRAVRNGKLDLVQAEAVGDLVRATAPAQARAALAQLDGALSRRLAELRERLLHLQALLAYDIDFPDEDDGPLALARLAREAELVQRDLEALLATAPAGERLRRGALVVLAGRPNAGKSSLFNALLGHQRALVTAVPGTTRDAVEADLEIDGWPVRVVDTAGVDGDDAPHEVTSPEGAATPDAAALDRLGRAIARRYHQGAEVLLVCVEAGRDLGEDERALAASPAALLVRTKADLAPDALGEGVAVAVPTGAGLEALRHALAARCFGGVTTSSAAAPALTRARHREAILRAREALDAARAELAPAGDVILAAHHVREAATALEELIGAVDVEEVLGRVFGEFCVGK